MLIRSDVELANLSDVGSKRTGNEDFFLYAEPDDDAKFERIGRLILVADGMGGCAGGEVASRLAAETVRDAFLDEQDHDAGAANPREVLIAGFVAAHRAILELARQEPELRGMGTTCSAAIVRHGVLHYGHVGDSRIYLIRGESAQQLTEDHSLVARMVRDGLITEQEAENHERRNILTAALGMESDSLAGDFPEEPIPLAVGDVLLLCSDGLHGLVRPVDMVQALEHQTLTEACRELVALANVRGGPDNITIQLLGIRRVET